MFVLSFFCLWRNAFIEFHAEELNVIKRKSFKVFPSFSFPTRAGFSSFRSLWTVGCRWAHGSIRLFRHVIARALIRIYEQHKVVVCFGEPNDNYPNNEMING